MDDKEALLAILAAHGQQFMNTFELPSAACDPNLPSKKRKLSDDQGSQEETSEEEWTGFGNDERSNDLSDDDEDGVFEDIEDDEFTSEVIANRQPETVVFGGQGVPSSTPRLSKSQMRAFMSAKVSRLKGDDVLNTTQRRESDEDKYEDERSNVENDALLHTLVHTRLLSASRKDDLDLKPAERRRAMQGRLWELAAGAKLGAGESSVRIEERNKASKLIRLGLERKEKERQTQALEEAKNLGNYHKSIKHIYDTSLQGPPDRRKRDKGLKMGVGQFSKGVLNISKNDLTSTERRSSTNGTKRKK